MAIAHKNSSCLPVCVPESKNVLVVSTVMVAKVPSMICALESRRPRYRQQSSDCDDCLRKLRQRIISSVVDWRRNPLAIRISSVVDCRRMAGARSCAVGGAGAPLPLGDASLEEQVEEDSGDRGECEPRRVPAMEVDCRRSLPRRPCPTGETSRSPVRSGERWGRESRRPRGKLAESGERESRRAFLVELSSPSGERVGCEPRRPQTPGGRQLSSMAVDCLGSRNLWGDASLPVGRLSGDLSWPALESRRPFR